MKKQLICHLLLFFLSTGINLADAKTQLYPTDKDIEKLMPDFHLQIEYWNQRREPQSQNKARLLAETWPDLSVASFLGRWGAIEETKEIYPSKIEGQVCIISMFSTPYPEVEFELGTVVNQRIYSQNNNVLIREGNYLGVAWKNENEDAANIYVYRLIAPTEVPTLAFWKDWSGASEAIENFNAAGCLVLSTNS